MKVTHIKNNLDNLELQCYHLNRYYVWTSHFSNAGTMGAPNRDEL